VTGAWAGLDGCFTAGRGCSALGGVVMGAWTGLAGTDFSAGEACFEEKQPILLIIVDVFQSASQSGLVRRPLRRLKRGGDESGELSASRRLEEWLRGRKQHRKGYLLSLVPQGSLAINILSR
jgi:hypothetical protein